MVDLDRIVLGDKSLSAREIWGAEYQENVCVLIKKENVELLRKICERERIYFMVIGRVTSAQIVGASPLDSGKIEVFSNRQLVVDLPVDLTYTDIPQHVYTDSTRPLVTRPLVLPNTFSLTDLVTRTFHLLSVGSKRFFVNKFDRSITGLIASQPVRLRLLPHA